MKHATLRQLKVFESVARHLSFSRAAEELHLTQPAVSTQVGKLEEHAGNALFEQFRKKIYLTPAGAELLRQSRAIIQQFEQAEAAMAQFRGVRGGRLDVGVISAGDYFFPHLLVEFIGRHSGVTLNFTVHNREELLACIGDNLTDLAIMVRPPLDMDTVLTSVRKTKKAVVVHDSIAERDEIVEHRTKVGNENRRRAALDNNSIDRESQLEFLIAQHGLVSTDHVGHESEASLQPLRGLRDHRRIKADSNTDREPPAIAQAAEIHRRLIPVQKHRNRARRIQRNAQRSRDHVGGSAAEHSERRPLMGERTQDFHHRSIPAEREDGVVLVRVGFGEDSRVTRRFGRHCVARHSGILERFLGFRSTPRAAAGRGVHDQQDSLDSPRRELHRCRRAHAAASRTLRTCTARFSAVNGF